LPAPALERRLQIARAFGNLGGIGSKLGIACRSLQELLLRDGRARPQDRGDNNYYERDPGRKPGALTSNTRAIRKGVEERMTAR